MAGAPLPWCPMAARSDALLHLAQRLLFPYSNFPWRPLLSVRRPCCRTCRAHGALISSFQAAQLIPSAPSSSWQRAPFLQAGGSLPWTMSLPCAAVPSSLRPHLQTELLQRRPPLRCSTPTAPFSHSAAANLHSRPSVADQRPCPYLQPLLVVLRGACRLFGKMRRKPRAAAALQFILHFPVASHRSRVCCAANSTSECPPGVCCFAQPRCRRRSPR
jgi:hypothetical protein